MAKARAQKAVLSEEALSNEEKPRIINDVSPSLCRVCGSQERSEYGNVRRREGEGTCNITGRQFMAMIFRDCTCLNCGQRRCDRSPVFISEENSAAESE